MQLHIRRRKREIVAEAKNAKREEIRKKPESITLVGEHLGALDKGNMEMVVSLKEKRVLKAPTDQVTPESIVRMPEYWLIKLNVNVVAERDRTLYDVVSGDAFTDAAGRSFPFADVTGSTVTASHDAGEKVHTQSIRIPADRDCADPLTFNIFHYPACISKPFEVRIK